MSPGLTTQRIYLALRSQIVAGKRRPGERLDPARLAAELNASPTPVRDALHRLLGERLVDAYPHHGFQVPLPTETGLRELYAWNGDLLSILLRAWRAGAVVIQDGPLNTAPNDVGFMAEVLFDAIARTLGTSEHRRAVRQASDLLHRARQVEAAVLAGVEAEVEHLTECWEKGDIAALRPSLRRYHRRRLDIVPGIVAQLVRG